MVFHDTGIEFPITHDYLKYIEDVFKIKITITGLTDDKAYIEGLKKNSMPYQRNLWCNGVLKLNHWKKYIKEKFDCPNSVELLGMRKQESLRRSDYTDRGILKDMSSIHFALPILEETEEMMKKNFRKEKIRLLPLYRHFERTGCYPCPNHNLSEWKTLRVFYPELYCQSMVYFSYAAEVEWYKDKYIGRDLLHAIRDDIDICEARFKEFAITEEDLYKYLKSKNIKFGGQKKRV